MRVLHLLGNNEDTGGILSVVRSLMVSAPTDFQHFVWVNRGYRERRSPPLNYRFADCAMDEDESHLRLLRCGLKAWPELKQLLTNERFDVVHGHTRGAFPLMLRLMAGGHRSGIYTCHTYAKRVRMYRLASRLRGIRWVYLTPTMTRHYGIQAKPGRIDIISSCCSDEYFQRPLRSHSSLPDDRPIRLIGVGNIVSWKRWDLLVDGLLKLPQDLRNRFECTVYGPVTSDAEAQSYAEGLKKRILSSGLGNRFRLAGPTSNVGAALAASDCYVVLSRNEPCSVALIEAMAGGMPAMVSDSGGNLDIVRPGVSGIPFKTDSPEDLAAVLGRMARGEVRWGSPGQIRESVRQRSATEVSKLYHAIYRQLTENRGL